MRRAALASVPPAPRTVRPVRMSAHSELGLTARRSKHERSDAYDKLKKELIESLGAEVTDVDKKLAKKYYADLQWEVVRNMIVDDRIRLYGAELTIVGERYAEAYAASVEWSATSGAMPMRA